MKKIIYIIVALFLFTISYDVIAHSGRTDKKGCHADKKHKTRHCHR